jgi:multidrug efflux pump subunit AcrA (membrane-fusion protein)
MRGKWLLFGGCLILLAIAAGAITVWRKQQSQPAPAAPAPPPAVVSGDLSLSGKVEARNVVPVKSPSAGTVEEYLVNEGEEVYEGQLLARLNNPTLSSEREQAKERADKAQERLNQLESQMLAARLEVSRGRAEAARIKDEYARTDRAYQRQSMLNQQGATPRLTFEKAQKEFENARADLEATTARQQVAESRITDLTRDIEAARKTLEERNTELENAEANLQATQVHAPVDGIILTRKGDAGVEIQQGEDTLFEIATDLGNLQITIEINESQQKLIKEGADALVFLSEMANEPIPGQVALAAEGRLTVLFANPNPLIKPGLTAQVKIRLP